MQFDLYATNYFPILKVKVQTHTTQQIKGMHMSCIQNCQVAYGLCAIWSLNCLCLLVLYRNVSLITLIHKSQYNGHTATKPFPFQV